MTRPQGHVACNSWLGWWLPRAPCVRLEDQPCRRLGHDTVMPAAPFRQRGSARRYQRVCMGILGTLSGLLSSADGRHAMGVGRFVSQTAHCSRRCVGPRGTGGAAFRWRRDGAAQVAQFLKTGVSQQLGTARGLGPIYLSFLTGVGLSIQCYG